MRLETINAHKMRSQHKTSQSQRCLCIGVSLACMTPIRRAKLPGQFRAVCLQHKNSHTNAPGKRFPSMFKSGLPASSSPRINADPVPDPEPPRRCSSFAMSGFRFLSLPVELQVAVFEQLVPAGTVTTVAPVAHTWPSADRPQLMEPYREGSRTLARVCRTSRHFNRIATLLLYRVAVAKDRRQLLCLFRTLATVPLLRPFVRGVVWAGRTRRARRTMLYSDVTDGRHPPLKSTAATAMAALLAGDTWMSELLREHPDWPGENIHDNGDGDKILSRHLGAEYLRGPGYIAGALLALTPRVEFLFSVFGESEWLCALDLLHNPQPPLPYPFLGNLRSVSIDCFRRHSSNRGHLFRTLWPLLFNCPLLESIEVRGGMPWRSHPEITNNRVKQIVLRSASEPDETIHYMAAIFPQLTALYAELFGTRMMFPLPAVDAHFTTGMAALADTLEVLHITSPPGETWELQDIGGELFLVLGKMKRLKHLVAESSFLFGRQTPERAFDMGFLPESLVSIHIIDFWCVAGHEYYPPLVNNLGPEIFMAQMLTTLLAECDTRLKALRATRVTSPIFDDMRFVWKTDAEELISEFAASFKKRGVELSVSTPSEQAEHGQWNWSRIRY